MFPSDVCRYSLISAAVYHPLLPSGTLYVLFSYIPMRLYKETAATSVLRLFFQFVRLYMIMLVRSIGLVPTPAWCPGPHSGPHPAPPGARDNNITIAFPSSGRPKSLALLARIDIYFFHINLFARARSRSMAGKHFMAGKYFRVWRNISW